MNYFISRETQEYGPYTLADLQRYASTGEILLTDLAHGEGLADLQPVGQIIGTIPAAPRPVPAAPLALLNQYPDPPNLHWALVLLFGILTCGVFSIVWDIIQAAWLKKVDPQSKALGIYIGAVCVLGLIFVLSFVAAFQHMDTTFVGIFQIAYSVVLIFARFSMKHSLEQHFNGPEPMGLILNGIMTFFFGGIYFQYHFNDIVRRKNADRMTAGLPIR